MRRGVCLTFGSLVLAAAIATALPAGRAEASQQPGQLDGRVARVAAVAAQGDAVALRAAERSGLEVVDDRVQVVVEAPVGRGEDAVRGHGGEVVRRVGDLLQALVPPAELRAVGQAPGVALVRAPYAAFTAAVTGQGVTKMNASAWHAAAAPGFRGAGVKIAVIDLGFGGLEGAVASGDLPPGLSVIDRCGGAVASTAHGVGVAEIVHEVAPGAELTLICISTEVDLAQALADAKARGVRVIVHSVIWFNTSRGDGTGAAGTPEATAAAARASGILWVNAAGNQAQKHWGGQFSDPSGDGLHEFVPGDPTNSIGVPSTGEVCAFLRWDEWPVTDDDLDLELVLGDGTVFASSTFRQDGNDRPTEAVCGTPGGAQLSLRVRRFAGTGSPRFDLFWVAPGQLEHQVASGSLTEPSTSPQVLAVGAICSHTGALEPFSSRGPTLDGRAKPDLVSYDAVSGQTFGTSTGCTGTAGFLGTSAAAPHVAGAAALVLEERPGLTPAALQDVLEEKSIDLAPAGVDDSTGHGRLYLSTDPPAATTLPAPLVEQTSATVAGAVLPGIVRTTFRFDYGTSAAYGSSTTVTPASGSSVTAPLTGLAPETTYHYRLVATNPFGAGTASDGTFTTLAYRPPTVATGAAGDVGSSTARLTATVNPNGKPTTVLFEFGSSTSYGATTASVSLPAGNTATVVSINAGGLASQATSHYRVVAENELGRTTGDDRTVTTTASSSTGGSGGGAPDLEVTAVADRGAAGVGETALYRARVRLVNVAASSGSSEAVLTAVLPAGTELVSTKVNRGSGCSGATTVVCPLSFISAQVVGEVDLVVRFVQPGVATVAVSVRTAEQDPNPANNAATAAVTVSGPPSATAALERPTIVRRQAATAGAAKAVVRGASATVRAQVRIERATGVRLRVVDLRTGRTVRLAGGSRLGAKLLRSRAAGLATPLTRSGSVGVAAVLDRASLVRGRRYALELVASDARGRTARLRVTFTL